MSLIGPPFEHDVFFSYAHADVEGRGGSETKAWCQQFAKNLRGAFKRFLNSPSFPFIWTRTRERPDAWMRRPS
jgi:hypothetical protein